MIQELIPRPTQRRPVSPESGKRVAPIRNIGQELINRNIMDAVVYEQFKLFVRDTATKHLPDTMHKHNMYDVRLWRRVIKEVLEQYPQLKKCFRAWPIEDYYNYWASENKNRCYSRARKPVLGVSRKVGKRLNRSSSSSRADPLSFHQSVGYMNNSSHSNGSPALQSGRNTVTWIQSPHRVQDATSYPNCRSTTILSTYSDVQTLKEEQSELPLQSSARFNQPSISRPHAYSLDARTLLEKYPEVCSSCGALPQILEEHRVDLTNFLTTNNMTDMFPALKSFGVLHDGHLHVLMLLDNRDREEVMAGILSRPDMMTFTKYLRYASMPISTSDIMASPMVTDITMKTRCSCRCPSARFDGSFSRKLVKFMRSQNLEMLVPIATALYGITGDLQFERICKFDAEDFGSFMRIGSAKVPSFHQRLLHLALQKARRGFVHDDRLHLSF